MLLVFFSVVGGHWALLHSVTWAEIVREYSSEGSLVEAVVRIATNQEPCHVCDEAAEGHGHDEPRTAGGRGEKKTEGFSLVGKVLSPDAAARPFLYPPDRGEFGKLRNDEPAYPVPIGA